MGLRSWIRQRLNGDLQRIDLVAPGPVEIPPPARVGLRLDPMAAPWSVARLMDLLREAEHQPTITTLQAARLARHRLSRFWLDAPVDQLQALYDGELGSLQRLLLQAVPYLIPVIMRKLLSLCVKQWDRVRAQIP